MSHPFFEFFNEDRPFIDPDEKNWPKEWNEIYFKSYPRLKQVKLPNPKLQELGLSEAIIKRKTDRNFSGDPINIQQLSNLLFYAAGITRGGQEFSRAYPSGGARYPIEIYPAVFNASDFDRGIYHYNVKNHVLELISSEAVDLGKIKNALRVPFAGKAAFALVFSMVPGRSFS